MNALMSMQNRWVIVFIFHPIIPAAQEDDSCSEKSGKGGQEWHEAHVVFLQPEG